MNPEHQALEDEGGDLAAQLVPYRIGDTNPSAHLRLQVADWERRCALAGVDGNMEARVEKNIDAIRALYFEKLSEAYHRSQLGAFSSGYLGGLFSTGDTRFGGLGVSEYRIPNPMDSFHEVEISSYPREIRVEMGARMGPSDLLRMVGMPEPLIPEYMGQRIGFSMAQLIASKPDRDDGLNRKQRRAQAAMGRKGEALPTADGSKTITGKMYFRAPGGDFEEMNGGKETTVTWRPL